MLKDCYCTNCGADLEYQYGFRPSIRDWRCEECGNEMIDFEYLDIDNSADTVWFCDECDACLNKQIGFSEIYDYWICDQCGHENHISDDEIYDSREDFETHQAIDCFGKTVAGLVGATAAMIAIAAKKNEENERRIEKEKQEKEAQKRMKRRVKRKRLWSALFNKKMLMLNIGPELCVGKKCSEVIELFQKNGFFNVRVNVVDDLEMGQENQEDIVTDIVVEGNSNFVASMEVQYDSEISITIHKLKKVFPPLSPQNAKGMSSSEVAEMFKKAGFVYVEENAVYDIIFGWVKKKGTVEAISIGGDKEYKQNSLYRIDTKIVIHYHTFKWNKA
ncbi:MAG: hypothetical protein HFI07_11555 [Lachnospiraceae bacterium]|nr:hypothetical protein [Lachnospiraceae bacterium]